MRRAETPYCEESGGAMPEVRSDNADVESIALLGPADDAMTMMAAPIDASEQRAPLEVEDLVAWVRRAG